MFQPYQDKENSSQLGVMARPRTAGPLGAPVGKVFQSSQSNVTNPTPRSMRKALGDLNKNVEFSQSNLLSKKSSKKDQQAMPIKKQAPLQLPAPASKPSKIRASENQNSTLKKADVRPPNTQMAPPDVENSEVEEIELMPVEPEEEDDFSDLWPLHEQPATYLDKILAWRPSRILPYHGPESDEDDHILDANSSISSVEDLADDSLPEITWEPEVDLAEIPLPPIEYLDLGSTDVYNTLH